MGATSPIIFFALAAEPLGAAHRHQVTLIAWVGVLLLLALFGWLGARFSKIESRGEFLLMGRGVGFWLFFGAYTGASIGGASLAGFTGEGYASGISSIWLIVVSSLTVPLFAAFFGPAINRFGRRHGAFTLADFLVWRFGPGMRGPALVLTYLRPAFITGLQFLALGTLLRAAFGLDTASGVLLGASVVLAYSMLGGQYSAITSQWLQALFQGLGMFLFLVLAIGLHGSLREAGAALTRELPASFLDVWSIDPALLSVWVISMGLFYFVDPWLYQWAYMARDQKTSRNALVVASVSSPWTAVSFLAGMLLAAAVRSDRLNLPDDIGSDLVYLHFIQNHVGTGVAAFLLVSFLMTVLSCASSFLMNGATILQSDLLERVAGAWSRRHPVRVGRLAVLATGLFGVAAALWIPVLVPLWIIGQTIAVSGLFWPVLAAWYWPRATSAGAIAALVSGSGSSFAWAIGAWLQAGSANALWHGLHAAHVGMGLSLLVLVTVSLATPARKPA
ncbi:MAG: sodium:solute symporter family protein [Acidobacteriota bacterium]|nr:sodium:solute symporter family protein [Acidobacteriota bacterium]